VVQLVRRSLGGEEFAPTGAVEVARSRGRGHVDRVLGVEITDSTFAWRRTS
jgi:hypothetical protein